MISIKKKNEILHKRIRLYPTDFSLDVYICKDLELLCKRFAEEYGESVEYWRETYIGNDSYNSCNTISSREGSNTGDKTVIVINMDEFSYPILAHEAFHAICDLSDITDIEVGVKSQEWVAYMIDYIMHECEELNK